jgi:formylglycine-generating enzyme required for sulfatase activity
VPAGEFLMGSKDADRYAYNNEKPQHTVYLNAYWVDRTEVTNAMFAKFMTGAGYRTDAEVDGWGYILNTSTGLWDKVDGANWQHPYGPTSNLDGLDDQPVVQLTWNDATAYCEWAGRRLPSEAEWEKAARGTDGRLYPWGNEAPDCTRTNDGGCLGKTAAVGSYSFGASPYGALDMSGNVWQWVNDWYSETYYASSPKQNPVGPAPSQYRVLRGGAWDSIARDVRTAMRLHYSPVGRGVYIGFRCVRSP